MRSTRQKLIDELKATGDYLEVTADDREQLLDQIKYVKGLCKERAENDARLVKELTEIRELVALTKGNGWQDSLISEIDEAIRMLS